VSTTLVLSVLGRTRRRKSNAIVAAIATAAESEERDEDKNVSAIKS